MTQCEGCYYVAGDGFLGSLRDSLLGPPIRLRSPLYDIRHRVLNGRTLLLHNFLEGLDIDLTELNT